VDVRLVAESCGSHLLWRPAGGMIVRLVRGGCVDGDRRLVRRPSETRSSPVRRGDRCGARSIGRCRLRRTTAHDGERLRTGISRLIPGSHFYILSSLQTHSIYEFFAASRAAWPAQPAATDRRPPAPTGRSRTRTANLGWAPTDRHSSTRARRREPNKHPPTWAERGPRRRSVHPRLAGGQHKTHSTAIDTVIDEVIHVAV
jgi:hypothetical protein